MTSKKIFSFMVYLIVANDKNEWVYHNKSPILNNEFFVLASNEGEAHNLVMIKAEQWQAVPSLEIKKTLFSRKPYYKNISDKVVFNPTEIKYLTVLTGVKSVEETVDESLRDKLSRSELNEILYSW